MKSGINCLLHFKETRIRAQMCFVTHFEVKKNREQGSQFNPFLVWSMTIKGYWVCLDNKFVKMNCNIEGLQASDWVPQGICSTCFEGNCHDYTFDIRQKYHKYILQSSKEESLLMKRIESEGDETWSGHSLLVSLRIELIKRRMYSHSGVHLDYCSWYT